MENPGATSITTLHYNKGKRIRCGKKDKIDGGCIIIEKVDRFFQIFFSEILKKSFLKKINVRLKKLDALLALALCV